MSQFLYRMNEIPKNIMNNSLYLESRDPPMTRTLSAIIRFGLNGDGSWELTELSGWDVFLTPLCLAENCRRQFQLWRVLRNGFKYRVNPSEVSSGRRGRPETTSSTILDAGRRRVSSLYTRTYRNSDGYRERWWGLGDHRFMGKEACQSAWLSTVHIWPVGLWSPLSSS